MAKRGTALTWQVVLKGTTWDRPESLADLVGDPRDDAAAAQHLWRRRPILLAAIGTILLCTLIIGYVVWRQAQMGYEEIEAEIKTAVDLESWLIQTGSHAVGAMLIDGDAPVDWRNQLVKQEYTQFRALSGHNVTIQNLTLLQDDLAQVTLLIAQTNADPTAAYRTTRFYRLVDGSWLRTPPAPEVWGVEEIIETTHFVFHFRHRDRDAVETTAADIDTIYAELRRDMALADYAADRLRIDVALQLPADATLRIAQNRMAVLSPLVQGIPTNTSNAEILTKSIVHQLVRHVTDEAQLRATVFPEWSRLLHGVQLWQAYAGSNSLPRWQTDMIRWLQTDAVAMRLGEREPSAADLEILCRIYVVWGHTLPLNPSPLTLCIDSAWHRHVPYKRPWPHRLQELASGFDAESVQNGWTENWMERLAAATLVEYLAETHGRDRLPVLIASMGLYSTWEELVPLVAGVSAEEFEAGWQTYVASRYGRQYSPEQLR